MLNFKGVDVSSGIPYTNNMAVSQDLELIKFF